MNEEEERCGSECGARGQEEQQGLVKEDEQAGQEGQGLCCEWVEQNGSETVSAEEWI